MQTFTSITFYQKKKDILLYKACDGFRNYFLKCTDNTDFVIGQAFRDEFHALHTLSHPGIPAYYRLMEQLTLPGQKGSFLALCMEDCTSPSSGSIYSLSSIKEIMIILHKTAKILSYLLENGILYTDLNPSNLLIRQKDNSWGVTLVDYTYCYYFLRNPHPDYDLRFSYDLSPRLRGQQILIQELSLLLQELLYENSINHIPSSVYRLLETGKNPSEAITLKDFSAMIAEISI